jgi:hypothetical protein
LLKQQQSVNLLITVSPHTAALALRSIHACDICSNDADMPFARLLDRLTGHFGSEREYVLTDDLLCPWCDTPIADDTLVEVHTMAMAAKA